MDHVLEWMDDLGILLRIENQFTPAGITADAGGAESNVSFGLLHLFGIWVVLAFGIIAASVAAACEQLMRKKKKEEEDILETSLHTTTSAD